MCDHHDHSPALSRRALIRGGMLLGVAAAAVGPIGAVREAAAEGPPAGPAEALERLRVGQARFAAGEPIAPQRDLARLREVAPKQTPFASILGCADSRVPTEILYDQGFGDLFVVRVAGNIASALEIASLEYSVAVLGAQAIVVLGHSGCGAVKAALDGGEVPGQISTLYAHIAPALDRKHMDLAAATTANVRYQARKLRTSSTVLRQRLKDGRLLLTAGVFELDTGRVVPVEL